MPIQFTCSKCGILLSVRDESIGKRIRCPKCGEISVAEQPAAPLGAAVPQPGPPEAQSPAQAPQQLPITMLANRLVAGRVCPCCGRAIGLGQPVRNCQDCAASHHQECWDETTGCSTPGCRSGPKLPELAPEPAARGQAESGPTKPCPFCGEGIRPGARRCRFCNEWLDPKMRRKAEHSEADEDLTAGDWVFAIICSGIACIVSIVWMIQGKPKGKKLFMIAIIVQAIWFVISMAAKR